MQITLANLGDATAQQVFDQVATHMLTQGWPSTDTPKKRGFHESADCLYRGKNDRKCAAGCLIADHEYREGMEGKTWTQLSAHFMHVPHAHSEMIRELQKIHDDAEVARGNHKLKTAAQYRRFVRNFWLERLTNFASAAKLSKQALQPFAPKVPA